MKERLERYFGKGNIRWKPLLLCMVLPLAVGGVSALITNAAMEQFGQLKKPPLSPPDWLFPVVWTILFLLMGVSSYLVWRSITPRKQVALSIYGIQLAFNFFWSVLFFNFGQYLAAFLWLIALLVLIALMIYYFHRVEHLAAYLQIPYLVWVLFAGYLNIGVYLLNR